MIHERKKMPEHKNQNCDQEEGAYPHHAHIEPTTLCNLKCQSCSNEGISSQRKGRLTLANLKKIVKKNRFLTDVSLIGLGEPLLNPEIADMAAYLKEEGIVSRTATNGMNLHKVDLAKLLRSIEELVISFDSNEKDSFQRLRSGADFEKIVKNIKMAVNMKRTNNLPVVFSFQTVISKNNLDRLAYIPPLARELGIDKMRFSAVVQYNPDYNFKNINEDYRKARERIQSFQEPFCGDGLEIGLQDQLKSICDSNQLQFSFSGFEPRFKECWWPGKGIFITYDGYITPCCMRMDPSVFNFGNLFQQSFDELRRGERFNSFINSFKNNLCPWICKECPV